MVDVLHVTLLATNAFRVLTTDLWAGGGSGMAGVAVFSHEEFVRVDRRSGNVGSIGFGTRGRERDELRIDEHVIGLIEHVALFAPRDSRHAPRLGMRIGGSNADGWNHSSTVGCMA